MSRDNYSVGYETATATFFSQRRAEIHAAFFLPYLQPGMKLLDAGCGPGTITVGLASRIAPGEVFGIDIEASQIELARSLQTEHLSGICFEVANLHSLPYADESFDAAFTHGVLEHLQNPLAALKEIWRVLKPGAIIGSRHADFGGFLLEPTPSPLDQFVTLFERLMRHNGADPQAGRNQLRWLLEAGFESLHVSASYDCWSATSEQKRITAEFLQTLVSDSSFARQAFQARLATRKMLDEMSRAFIAWADDPASFAAEAWTEVVARKPL